MSGRGRRVSAALLALALALSLAACGGGGETREEPGYVLYFLSVDDTGPALAGVPLNWEGEEPPTARQLMTALLAGPADEETVSPFPSGTTLRSLREEDGVLYVDLSENYGGLTDVNLTIADYAITLTLCQLDGVDGVCITAEGQPQDYRSHQILRPDEILLSGAPAQAEEEEQPGAEPG